MFLHTNFANVHEPLAHADQINVILVTLDIIVSIFDAEFCHHNYAKMIMS